MRSYVIVCRSIIYNYRFLGQNKIKKLPGNLFARRSYISDIGRNLKTSSIGTVRVLTNGDVSNCSTSIQDISPF